MGDVYFVIFRHKWKIILIAAAGVVAAAAFYVLHPPLYQSEAQIFIRYISDVRPVSAPTDNQTMTSPDSRGSGVINAEIQILKSFDLAKLVAAAIGPEKILAKSGGGKDLISAAAMVHNGLSVEAAPSSSVINITFQHPDPMIVQPVLSEIIIDYQTKHSEIHGATGTDDFAAEEATQIRALIAQTERDLMIAKTNAGIVSLEETKRSLAEQTAIVSGQLLDAELDLDTRREMMAKGTALPVKNQPTTNAVVVGEISAEQIDEYNRICARLGVLQKKNAEFMAQGYSEDNVLIKGVNAQIIQARDAKKNLEEKNPGIVGLGASTLISNGQSVASAEDDPARLALLESKVIVLKLKLNQLRSESFKLGEFEPKIMDLTLKSQFQHNARGANLYKLRPARQIFRRRERYSPDKSEPS